MKQRVWEGLSFLNKNALTDILLALPATLFTSAGIFFILKELWKTFYYLSDIPVQDFWTQQLKIIPVLILVLIPLWPLLCLWILVLIPAWSDQTSAIKKVLFQFGIVLGVLFCAFACLFYVQDLFSPMYPTEFQFTDWRNFRALIFLGPLIVVARHSTELLE